MTAPEITDEMLNPGEAGSMWNHWPAWPIVKVDKVDKDDPYAMLQFGARLGSASKARQVRTCDIPTDVPIYRAYPSGYTGDRKDMPRHALCSVTFCWASPKGQEDSYEGRHVLVLFEPPSKWDSTLKRMALVGPAVVVSIGCTHEYETLTKRNCFIRQRCTICGHTYAIDSGD